MNILTITIVCILKHLCPFLSKHLLFNFRLENKIYCCVLRNLFYIYNIQKAKNVTGANVTTIQPNIGVGIKYKVFALDYAMTNIGNVSTSLYSHIFTVKIDINKKLLIK